MNILRIPAGSVRIPARIHVPGDIVRIRVDARPAAVTRTVRLPDGRVAHIDQHPEPLEDA